MSIQVPSSHYDFRQYVDKARWASYWHQVDEIVACKPETVLEIGGGGGILRSILRCLGIRAETADVDPDLLPDHIASVTALPFPDNSYDLIACFQVLEHLPFEQFTAAASELARVSRRHVILSLPNAAILYSIVFRLPKIGFRRIDIPKPFVGLQQHRFNGEHYWELGKRGFPPERIVSALEQAGLNVVRTFRVPENSYHQFFICTRT